MPASLGQQDRHVNRFSSSTALEHDRLVTRTQSTQLQTMYADKPCRGIDAPSELLSMIYDNSRQTVFLGDFWNTCLLVHREIVSRKGTRHTDRAECALTRITTMTSFEWARSSFAKEVAGRCQA
jgi:hypothetical protein